jgi:uncharacterized protein YjiS (DUF1127 family)
MNGFQSSRLQRGTTWLARAVAYGGEKCGLRKSTSFFVMFARNANDCQSREVAHANPTQMFRRSVILLGRWRRRVEDRNRLSGMSKRQPCDIGLSPQNESWTRARNEETGVPEFLIPFQVDQSWYERYWWQDSAPREPGIFAFLRRILSRSD